MTTLGGEQEMIVVSEAGEKPTEWLMLTEV